MHLRIMDMARGELARGWRESVASSVSNREGQLAEAMSITVFLTSLRKFPACCLLVACCIGAFCFA